ncbi:hypothetical protein [Lysinibacillus xylanilyticus]|uniref:hypothetical protein n=1 Tax=Lysinibacillus xylanilyticus TaxID=582475 RepID=UPI0036D820B0
MAELTFMERLALSVQKQAQETPPLTQVFDTHKEEEQEAKAPEPVTIVQQVIAPRTIKQNDPGVPAIGFTLEVLANELGVILEKALHRVGMSSVGAESFGMFSEMGIVPNGFELIEDTYTNRKFYVLINSNRSAEIFKPLVKALNSSSADVISFPYVVETTLQVPLRFLTKEQEFENQSIKVSSLYMTPQEINGLNFKFIKEIQFCGKSEAVDGSIDLLSLQIDREEWKAAPYRV